LKGRFRGFDNRSVKGIAMSNSGGNNESQENAHGQKDCKHETKTGKEFILHFYTLLK